MTGTLAEADDPEGDAYEIIIHETDKCARRVDKKLTRMFGTDWPDLFDTTAPPIDPSEHALQGILEVIAESRACSARREKGKEE